MLKKNRIFMSLIFLLVFIFLLNFVFAQEHDTAAITLHADTSSYRADNCGDPVNVEFIVKHTSLVRPLYGLSVDDFDGEIGVSASDTDEGFYAVNLTLTPECSNITENKISPIIILKTDKNTLRFPIEISFVSYFIDIELKEDEICVGDSLDFDVVSNAKNILFTLIVDDEILKQSVGPGVASFHSENANEPGFHSFAINGVVNNERISKTGSFLVKEKNECYDIDVLNKNVKIPVGSSVFPLIISNKGQESFFYIETDSENTHLNRNGIYLEKDGTGKIDVHTNYAEEGSFEANIIIKNDEFSKIVPVSIQVTGAGIVFSQWIILLSVFSMTLCGTVLLYLLFRFLFNLIENPIHQKLFVAGIVVFVVFLLWIIGSNFYVRNLDYVELNLDSYKCNYSDDICYSNFYLVMKEDSVLIKELSTILESEERSQNRTDYSFSGHENINIEIINSSVEIIPKRNWHGTEEIILQRRDDTGKELYAQKIIVQVQDEFDNNVSNHVIDYGNDITFFIAYVLSFFLFLNFLEKKFEAKIE